MLRQRNRDATGTDRQLQRWAPVRTAGEEIYCLGLVAAWIVVIPLGDVGAEAGRRIESLHRVSLARGRGGGQRFSTERDQGSRSTFCWVGRRIQLRCGQFEISGPQQPFPRSIRTLDESVRVNVHFKLTGTRPGPSAWIGGYERRRY